MGSKGREKCPDVAQSLGVARTIDDGKILE